MSFSNVRLFAEHLASQIDVLFVLKTASDCIFAWEKKDLGNLYYYKNGTSESIVEIRLDVKPDCIASLEELVARMKALPKNQLKGDGFEFICLVTEDHNDFYSAEKYRLKVENSIAELSAIIGSLWAQCAEFKRNRPQVEPQVSSQLETLKEDEVEEEKTEQTPRRLLNTYSFYGSTASSTLTASPVICEDSPRSVIK